MGIGEGMDLTGQGPKGHQCENRHKTTEIEPSVVREGVFHVESFICPQSRFPSCNFPYSF